MLTEAKIKALAPSDRVYRVGDGRGLSLVVTPGGHKWWHFNYTYEGKSKKISMGVWPDVPLESRRDPATGLWIQGARQRSEEARMLVAQGVNPSDLRKASKQASKPAKPAKPEHTFETVALEWHERNRGKWTAGHAVTILSRLRRDCIPLIGSKGIETIEAPELLKLLRLIEERGANETAFRIQNILRQVWDYAIACGYVTNNPAQTLRKALSTVKGRHLPALTDPVKVAQYLRAIHGYHGTPEVRSALLVGVLTFVRPGELRRALWEEVDWEHAQWNIKADRMKMREAHAVPLSRQAMEVLKQLRAVTGDSVYIFPSPSNHKRPLSENGVLVAMRNLGFGQDAMTGHGVRAMARTLLDEQLHVPPALIEQQLAHVVRDPLGRAYNRTTHLPARRILMQLWADALDHLRCGNSLDTFERSAYQV